jgi:hypothetical protein
MSVSGNVKVLALHAKLSTRQITAMHHNTSLYKRGVLPCYCSVHAVVAQTYVALALHIVHVTTLTLARQASSKTTSIAVVVRAIVIP